MTTRLVCLALGLGALAGSVLLAADPAAADGWWGRGSIKDARSAAVPVPVPAPIPDHAARWYLRADVGVGFSTPEHSENGIIYGQNLYFPPDTSMPLSTPSHWAEDNTKAVFNYGAGFGYYWSSHFRTDLTFEGRTAKKLKIKGSYHYDEERYNGTDWEPTDNQVDGETSDTGELTSGLLLFNAYFDFVRAGPITPYIGAGVGFSVNRLNRKFSNREFACDPSGLYPWQNCLDLGSYGTSASDSSYDITFAAALSAGFTYSISPVTMLDVGYRYLYIGSSDINLNINGVQSNFSTGDTHEHQIRAGLRWNIQ